MKRTLSLCALLAVVAVLCGGCGVMVAFFPPPAPKCPLSIHEEANTNDDPGTIRTVSVPGTGLNITINTFPALTERDLIAAKFKDTPAGPSIELEFDDHGRMVLDTISTKGRDRYLVVCVDNKPIMAWYLNKRLTDGKFVLFGDFTEADAQEYLKAWDKQIRKNLAL